MYYITYYKTKRTIDNPKVSSDLRIRKLIQNPHFAQNKDDLIDKYLNIKSLTIDLEDIEYVKYAMKDKDLKHLVSLYVLINRVSFDAADAITILNNNYLNWLFINEIINCKWMVNYNEELNNLNLLNTVKRLLILIDQYEIVTDIKMKEKIINEIKLIKYYIDTILNKENDKTEFRTLKLGKRFIKGHN